MTTLPVISIPQQETASVILPHFADGGGWISRIVLVNPTDAPISGTVDFIEQGIAGASYPYSIPGKSSTVIQTPGAGGLRIGWARITPDPGTVIASGTIIFSYTRDGVVVSEAGVPPSPLSHAFRLYMDAAENVGTGIAVANPSDAPATVTFELANLSGVSSGITGSIQVPAQGQVALFANQITNFQGVTLHRGVLRISAPGDIAVIGIRSHINERGDFIFTTVSPVSESAPPATTTLFMPHFVDSGGFTTQFILFSGSANQAAAGTLRFFGQTGESLELTLRR
jgi:hypothetical protein